MDINWRLIRYARLGNLLDIELMLTMGADINAEDCYPMRRAAFYGHVEVVKMLLEHGAFPSDRAVRFAYANGNMEIVKLIQDWENSIIRSVGE